MPPARAEDRPPPHNLDAERAVLGAILLDNAMLKLVAQKLRSEDFFLAEHRRVFRAMLALAGQPIDLITLVDQLERHGELEATGGAGYISTLVDGRARVTNVEHHTTIVREKAALRRLAHLGDEIARRALERDANVEALAREFAAASSAVASGAGRNSDTSHAGFNLVPLADLLAEPTEAVSFIVKGRLPTGGLSLLAGKPKAGKSTLARCLALAVACGEPFLGWPTVRGPVIYLALEEKRAEVREHFNRMGATGEENLLVHAAQAPQNALPAVRELAERHRPVLIIIDPLLKLVRVKDGNDYAEVMAALEPLLVLARETGAHILAVHHLGKGERSEPGDSILGSTAFFAAVDTALLLTRMERYRVLSSIQRYGEDLAEHVLDFDPERRVVHLGGTKSVVDQEPVSAAILEGLAGRGEQTEPEIMEAVEGRLSVKRAALRALVQGGKVIRSGQGRRSDPFRYATADSSFSRSPDSTGTREQETQNAPQPEPNQEDTPVPVTSAVSSGESDSGNEKRPTPTRPSSISNRAE